MEDVGGREKNFFVEGWYTINLGHRFLPDGEIIIPLSQFWLGDFPPTGVYLELSALSHSLIQHKCYI